MAKKQKKVCRTCAACYAELLAMIVLFGGTIALTLAGLSNSASSIF